MEEQKERLVEAIEDSVTRVEFTIEDGYLVNIGVNLKNKEDVGRIDINDKVNLSRWLNNFKLGIIQSISNQPMEIVEVVVPREQEEVVISETKCLKCGGDLAIKKACCGNPNDIFRCKKCGRNYRISHGKPGRKLPPQSPIFRPKDTRG